MRPPRGLKITREGRYYIAFTFGVGLAASNTGNNLLFLILGMMLALIVVSGLLSEAALRRLEVERAPAGPYREGEPAIVGVILRNANRLLPSVGLEVVEVEGKDFRSVPGRCVQIAPGESGRANMRTTPLRRGKIQLTGLKVITRYPFGLFAKSRQYDLAATLIAWPSRVAAAPISSDAGGDEAGSPVPGRSGVEDLRGLRRFREGDESRRIHWRRSLRVGQTLIVERDAPEGRRVQLRLAPGLGEAFEKAVRVVAARAEDHLESGDEVALEAPAGFSVGFGGGPGHRRRLLSALALVPATEAAGEGIS